MQRHRLLIANALLTLIVLGSLWSRQLDAVKLSGPNQLKSAVLDYRGWKTSDVPLLSSDLTLLSPDMEMVRNYTSTDQTWVQLAVIAGHRKKTVHTPLFCMLGGGWDVITQRSASIPVAGVQIPVTQAVMVQNKQQILMTYYFTDGAYRTSSLIPFQFVEMLKRFRPGVTMGALVRVIVPIVGDTKTANDRTVDFLSATSPKVEAILRSADLRLK